MGDEFVRCVGLTEDPIVHGSARLSVWAKWRFVWSAAWQVARWRPDLIICSHLGLGPIGCLLAYLGFRPYWIVVYGIEAWVSLPHLKRIALRHANRVIVISAFSREQVVKRHHIQSNRILNLPCTLDESLLAR